MAVFILLHLGAFYRNGMRHQKSPAKLIVHCRECDAVCRGSSLTFQVSLRTEQEFHFSLSCCINHIYTTCISWLFSFLCSDTIHLMFQSSWNNSCSCKCHFYSFCPQSNSAQLIFSTVFSSQPHEQCSSNRFIVTFSRTDSWRQYLSWSTWSQWKRRKICHTLMFIWDKFGPALYWYRHDSDLHAPQFILWKGAKQCNQKYIPDNRYECETSATWTKLTITKVTLADTALYYCALETQWYKV